MKFLILSSMILFSSIAMACKPAPLPKCIQLDAKVNLKEYSKLLKLVDETHALLSKHIVRPDNASSCFNNGFGVYYGHLFLEEVKKGNGKVCSGAVDTVKRAMMGVTAESEYVKDVKVRKELGDMQGQLNKKLKMVFK